MGGLGSGNTRQSGRLTTNQCIQISATDIKRYGLFDAPDRYRWQWAKGSEIYVDTRSPDKVYFEYMVEGESKAYAVYLDPIPQHLGGVRRWFICPNTRCGRRCKTLYLRRGYFLCRTCQNLGYRTEQASKSDQPYIQIEKIRRRLGWEAGYLNGHQGKPKGMHWTTYTKLVKQHEQHAEALNGVLRWLIERTKGDTTQW